MNATRRIVVRLLGCLLAVALLFFIGPPIGQSVLHAITPNSVIKNWKSEFDRLDGTFPRVPANETRRLEISRKLRQRSIGIDEGVDESIDHNTTPYTVFIRGCREWEGLLGW